MFSKNKYPIRKTRHTKVVQKVLSLTQNDEPQLIKLEKS